MVVGVINTGGTMTGGYFGLRCHMNPSAVPLGLGDAFSCLVRGMRAYLDESGRADQAATDAGRRD